MNLANKLTIFRIILVPIMVIIPYLNLDGSFYGLPYTYFWMLLIFIVASITDKLDGYIARSRNQVTTFGKFLDPLADKILVLSALVLLVELDKIPAWIPIIVLAFAECFRGTLTGAEYGLNMIATIMLLLSVVATIFSGADYMKNGKELLKD